MSVAKEALDTIQNEAARIVTGTTKLVSLNDLQNETGWETIDSRRNKHKLILLYKMKNGLCPPYLSNMIPPSVGSLSQYSLRNADDLTTIKSRTTLYYNSFLPSTVREWNSLPPEARNSDSIGSFKHTLNRNNISRPPKLFLYGDRKSQTLHTRLRTNCSGLNQHLFQKNIIESPLCTCGGIETTQHFFFSCPLYSVPRRDLLNSVSQYCSVTLQVLLYGDSTFSYEQNVSIFKHVHTFIMKSKRF